MVEMNQVVPCLDGDRPPLAVGDADAAVQVVPAVAMPAPSSFTSSESVSNVSQLRVALENLSVQEVPDGAAGDCGSNNRS